MDWLESLFYGLISGFAEILPISSAAHQLLMRKLFGVSGNAYLHDLLTHLVVFGVLLYSCSKLMQELNNRPVARSSRRSLRRPPEIRLVRMAVLPVLIALVFRFKVNAFVTDLLFPTLFLVLNGMILYVPNRMVNGNKDARGMSAFDGLLIGLCSALSVFPGISRIGGAVSAAVARGADKQHALNWALLLSVPVLIVLSGFDVFGLISSGFTLTSGILGYILTAVGAVCGSYFGIMLMRFLAVKTGFHGFAYYSWGLALFTFILYLTVV